jgi:hypothetical protein
MFFLLVSFSYLVKRKGIAKGTMIFLGKMGPSCHIMMKKKLRSPHNLNVVVMEIVTTNVDSQKQWLCYLISSQIWFINVLDGCQSTYK